jgi:hypothetical protein
VPSRKMKARVRCPFCNKSNVVITISVRQGGSGVDTSLHTHTGLYVDEVTGQPLRCTGVGRPIANRDLPPMSEWEEW